MDVAEAFDTVFLSTPSARRATVNACMGLYCSMISIHALCEEGDTPLQWSKTALRDFYPRPLRGGRPLAVIIVSSIFKFLSTPSARRATQVDEVDGLVRSISIHALCEEGDRRWSV